MEIFPLHFGNDVVLGFKLVEVPMTPETVLCTGGHRMRKKLRIRKKFMKRYGVRLVEKRIIPVGQMTVNEKDRVVYAHRLELDALRREVKNGKVSM
jgi:hypothetical protein